MQNYSFTQMAIGAIIILGILAIVYIATQAMGILIPGWVTQMLWVIFIVFVAVLAIKLISGLWNK